MSRSAAFTRILADVIGRPVKVAASGETSAVGAAALAFGAHYGGRLNDAAREMTLDMATVEPDTRTSAGYEDYYARWRDLAAHMEASP
jgi:sugar (pentulose or hexulose) kinase